MIINIQNEKQFQNLINDKGLILVKFSAPWCIPCKVLDPVLEEVSQENGIKILKVNVDDHPEIASEFRIMSVPTTYFIKDSTAQTVLNGTATKEHILKLINEINNPVQDVDVELEG